MKSFLSILSLVAAVPASAVEQSKKDEGSYDVSAKVSDQCVLLANKNCDGKTQGIRFETPSGYFISVEKINDRAQHVPFDQTYERSSIGKVSGRVGWQEHVTGTVARFGKAFQFTEDTTLNVEAYVGRLEGSVHLNAKADATLYPNSITIPAFFFHAGSQKIDFPGKVIFYNGAHKDLLNYNYATQGKSYFGGLKQSLGTALGLNPRTHLIVNQFAQAGLDRISYGAGAGVAYTSESDSQIGRRTSNICQQGEFKSSARFAFAISACAEKVKKDALYDLLAKKADPFAAKVNARIAEGQEAVDRFENRTGYGYQLPSYSGKDVLNALGIQSPYNHINTSFVVAASVHVGSGHLTVMHTQPIDKRRDGDPKTSVMMAYGF